MVLLVITLSSWLLSTQTVKKVKTIELLACLKIINKMVTAIPKLKFKRRISRWIGIHNNRARL